MTHQIVQGYLEVAGVPMTVISEKFWKGDQSWHYKQIIELGGHRLKGSIKRNAYDFQSYCRVSRWDGEKWQQVASEPFNEGLCCHYISYVHQNPSIEPFREDIVAVYEEAAQIIGIGPAPAERLRGLDTS